MAQNIACEGHKSNPEMKFDTFYIHIHLENAFLSSIRINEIFAINLLEAIRFVIEYIRFFVQKEQTDIKFTTFIHIMKKRLILPYSKQANNQSIRTKRFKLQMLKLRLICIKKILFALTNSSPRVFGVCKAF